MAQQVTPKTWAIALLKDLGIKPTSGNVAVIEEWEAREGGHWLNTARFNPLNTTQSERGATSINSVGVKAYTSWKQGLAATKTTLENGRYNNILSALHSGNDPAAISAIEHSPWAGAGGYHTWPTAASGHAYASTHVGSGNIPRQSSQPFTLPPITLAASSKGSGGSLTGWIAANITLVVVVLIVILVLKRK